ncbi:hypothetical protein ONZ45_g18848 [Pleurotus djamor]|nr:hypothetical protein ONZ45_g18848 [Pleurotus djamor]
MPHTTKKGMKKQALIPFANDFDAKIAASFVQMRHWCEERNRACSATKDLPAEMTFIPIERWTPGDLSGWRLSTSAGNGGWRTVFSLAHFNITTTNQLKTYLKAIWLPGATSSELDTLLSHYPLNPMQGSPHATGPLNILSPQFKRLASFQGDAVFQAPRRFFLDQRSGHQNTWAFLSKRFKATPFLGSFHASDIPNVYLGGELGDYLINFVNNLDPNGEGKGIHWPKYTTQSRNLVTFNDDIFFPVTLTQDTFRWDAINYLTWLTLANPI